MEQITHKPDQIDKRIYKALLYIHKRIDSISYFDRLFKQYTGETPTVYKKKSIA